MGLAEPPGWERPFYEPGGGEPFLFYAVFGDLEPDGRCLTGDAFAGDVPAGIEVRHYRRDAHPEWFAGFFTNQLGRLLETQMGAQSGAVREALACVVLVGSVACPETLAYLRAAVGVIVNLLDRGGVAVLDAFGLKWWTPDAWRSELWEPNAPVPLRHVDILVSEDEPIAGRPAVWVHTRGLRTFGRPDLSVRGVTQEFLNPVVDLCNRFIVLQALGGVLPEGQPVRMNDLPAGLACYHAGSVDDPDFNNVHIAIGRARVSGSAQASGPVLL